MKLSASPKPWGNGPQWRLVELADHLGLSPKKLSRLMRADPNAPKPVRMANHRSQQCGPAKCALYSLREFRAWWKSRQQKEGSGTA